MSSLYIMDITNIMYIMYLSSILPNMDIYNKVEANTNIKTIEKSKIWLWDANCAGGSGTILPAQAQDNL